MDLEVGSGPNPIRTDSEIVCVDLYHDYTPQAEEQDRYYKVKLTENFVRADGCFLPFKSNCFRLVYSAHTIEHSDNPTLFLRELVRVAKEKVIVKCPHRKGHQAKMPFHKWYLDENWFKAQYPSAKIIISQSEKTFSITRRVLVALFRRNVDPLYLFLTKISKRLADEVSSLDPKRPVELTVIIHKHL
ncbi:MAG: class I SAM-dependent methyltransferase [archaeon]|nr:class I SAM-dependent methyltransferase [archaeon]MCP8313183.1 class I SAM-dependent methyltransferase [archaeon]